MPVEVKGCFGGADIEELHWWEITSAQCTALVTSLFVRQMYSGKKRQLPDSEWIYQDGIMTLPQRGRAFVILGPYLHFTVSPWIPLSQGRCGKKNLFFFFNDLIPSLRLLIISASTCTVILLCRVLFRCLTLYLRYPACILYCFNEWWFCRMCMVCRGQTRYSEEEAMQRVCDTLYLHSSESRTFVMILS